MSMEASTWPLIISYSSSVNDPALFNTLSGIPIYRRHAKVLPDG